MKERIDIIASEILSCRLFIDVGCDHGEITKSMLDSGKCERAIFTDISEKCLKKAERLLYNYVSRGEATGVVTDGFKGIEKGDTGLIAGMGGEEIVKILSDAKKENNLPDTLILQPMKNFDKPRRWLVENHYKIEKDYLFYVKDKFYFLIVAKYGGDSFTGEILTEEEMLFGKTNVRDRGADFKRFVREEIARLSGFLHGENKELQEKIGRLKKYVD